MRSIAAIIFILAFNYSSLAQFINAGFESNVGLPSNTGEWALVDNWFNGGSSVAHPDYFHNNGTLGGDLPVTPFSSVNAHSGDGIMGFVAAKNKGLNHREYLCSKLASPLEVGKKYNVSFYITNGYITSVSPAGLGTSHMGACFTKSAPLQSDINPLHLNPQWEMHSVLYDREWIEISFSFIADDDYEYFTLGVFGDDTDKSITQIEGSSPQVAYYFVDDFFISEVPVEVSDTTEEDKDPNGNDDNDTPIEYDGPGPDFFIPNAFSPNGDGENDYFLPVAEPLDGYEMSIYNRWGELLFKSKSQSNGWDGKTKKGNFADANVYVWEIQYYQYNEEVEQDQLKRIHGSVVLVR